MDTHLPNGIRVAIADPCAMSRAGLTYWLLQEPNILVVAEADTDYSLIEIIQVYEPDVVLLDYSLCEFNCLNLIQLLQENRNTCKVIILANPTMNVAQKVRLAGANGYILKDETRDAIVSSVRRVVQRDEEFYMSDHAKKYLNKAAVEYESARLTPMEKRVLAYINHDNQTIADKLFLAAGTIRNHISSIYLRLNVSNRAEAVKVAQRYGVLQIDEG